MINKKNSRKVDFFIVGAPKCGTTAMIEYLRRHPEIFVPDAKEIHFFGSDLDWSPKTKLKERTLDDYWTFFSEVTENHKIIGEASVMYLYSKKAALEIYRYNPSAKIIMMLRNPVDMMAAWHQQSLNNGSEFILDFEQALNAEHERKKGNFKGKNLRLPEGLFYREIASYYIQVKRYFDVYPKENIHTIIFDDFKADTRNEYEKILRFLGVDTRFRTDLKAIHSRHKNRNQRIHNWITQSNVVINKIGEFIPSNKIKKYLYENYVNVMKVKAERTVIPLSLRHQLNQYFKEDINRLSKLIDNDLSFWYNLDNY